MKLKNLSVLIACATVFLNATEQLPTQTESYVRYCWKGLTEGNPSYIATNELCKDLRPSHADAFRQFAVACQHREQETNNSHIAVYHGRSLPSLAWLDVHQAIYDRSHHCVGTTLLNKNHSSIELFDPEQFVYLRNSQENIGTLDDLPAPDDVLKNCKTLADRYDETDEVSRCLLSGSLSLLAHASNESAFDMYRYNISVSPGQRLLMREALQRSGFGPEYAAQLLELYQEFFGEEPHGHIMQMLIPNGIAAKCAYVSRPFGIPYDQAVEKEFKVHGGRALKKNIVHDITAIKRNQFGMRVKYPQVRVMLASKYFANLNSGIKMYHHYSANPHRVYDFNCRRTALLQRMLKR